MKSDLRQRRPKTVQIRKRLQTTSRRGEGRARVGGLGAGQGCRWGAHGKTGQRLLDEVGGGLESRPAGEQEDLYRGGRIEGAPGSSPSHSHLFLL